MTYDEFIATQEDILEAFRFGEITEEDVEYEMEALQNQWEEEGVE
jgi:cell fate (sporulation/competence/biofilm development) regulator YlbF (YheA/YmcA/DUF963 family)